MLELGCGAAGLAAVAASRAARRIVCTDGSAEALRLLGRNLATNSHLFPAERVVLRQLVWDDPCHITALQVAHQPKGLRLLSAAAQRMACAQ
jgi:methylase of polypeptide subunit release factors